MARTRWISTMALLLTVSTALPVHAQPASGAAPAPAVDGDKRAEAKARYNQGITHYNLGEFDSAIVEFKAAYAISQAPGLLFNIAQSYRLARNYEQASYFYKTYLRLKVDAPNRADVEARIAEMEKALEEQKAIAASPPRGTVSPEGDKTTEPKPTEPDPKAAEAKPAEAKPVEVLRIEERKSGGSLKVAGLATAGAGAALLVTGAIFGSMAKSASDDLSALNDDMGTWTQAQQDKYDAGKRNNSIALISFIAGGAAVATGGTLWVMGMLRDRGGKSTSALVVPTQGGAAVTFGGAF